MATIFGTVGADTLTGTETNDKIYGYPDGGGAIVETITFANAGAIHASDYSFS